MYQRIEFAAATLLLVAIVGLVGIAAITRFMGAPIIWSIEVATAMFVWLIVLAVDLAMQQNRHFGLSLVLDSVSPRARRWIEIANIDAFDDTPLLDLKPYFPNCDRIRDVRVGPWAAHWAEWMPDEGLALEDD